MDGHLSKCCPLTVGNMHPEPVWSRTAGRRNRLAAAGQKHRHIGLENRTATQDVVVVAALLRRARAAGEVAQLFVQLAET
jgi:hypothetical protein